MLYLMISSSTREVFILKLFAAKMGEKVIDLSTLRAYVTFVSYNYRYYLILL